MDKCSLCRTKNLKPIYQPAGTLRGITVNICTHCGLVQSLPRNAKGDKQPRAAAGASFGNIRTGKVFRVSTHVEILDHYFSGKTPDAILDVGASRGVFVKEAAAMWRFAKITAVEPDIRVVPEFRDKAKWFVEPIEDFITEDKFNLIYCSHTLEHVADPVSILLQLSKLCAGVMFIEVPNIDFITAPDIIEEWFLDKHTYHWSKATLKATLEMGGWRVLQWHNDNTYLGAICSPAKPIFPNPTSEHQRVARLIADYAALRAANLRKLEDIAQRWNRLSATHSVVVWGAGRIYDALLQAGLDEGTLEAVFDSQREGYLTPDAMYGDRVDHIIVCSREYFEEIKIKALQLYPGAKVWRWDAVTGEDNGQ